MSNFSPSTGYVDVKLGELTKRASFRMGFLKILNSEINITLTELGDLMINEDPMVRYSAFADALYSAFKAYDLAQGNEINYNSHTCLDWALELSANQIKDFQEAMIYAVSLNNTVYNLGKEKQVENLQETKI